MPKKTRDHSFDIKILRLSDVIAQINQDTDEINCSPLRNYKESPYNPAIRRARNSYADYCQQLETQIFAELKEVIANKLEASRFEKTIKWEFKGCREKQGKFSSSSCMDKTPGKYALLLQSEKTNKRYFLIAGFDGNRNFSINAEIQSLDTLKKNEAFTGVILVNLTSYMRQYAATQQPETALLASIAQGEIEHYFTEGNPIQYEGGLNSSQERVLYAFAHLKEGIQMMKGPPGTGKTSTIVRILYQAYLDKKRTDRRHPIVLCGPSNKSVQVVADSFHKYYPNVPILLLGHQEQGYRRHSVLGDGECGYTAFGIDRAEAYRMLSAQLDDIRELLAPVVHEQLLLDSFRRYLVERSITNSDEVLQSLSRRLDIISAYLDYDVKERRVDMGWAHPRVLQALAHVRGVELHIWVLGTHYELVPHKVGDEDYSVYTPPNVSSRTDLVFVNENHFDRIEFIGYGENFPQKDVYPYHTIKPFMDFKSKKLMDKFKKNEIVNTAILFSTLSKLGGAIINQAITKIDTLIIDECGQAAEADILIPFSFKPNKVLLVGDEDQLQPTVLSKNGEKYNYHWSILFRLIVKCKQSYFMLDTQYRMHPEISRGPNMVFYQNKVSDGVTAKERQKEGVAPYEVIDIGYPSEEEYSLAAKSYRNLYEACVIVMLVRDAVDKGFSLSDVCIISPDALQVELIKHLCEKQGHDVSKLIVNTIDSSQGAEYPVVLISMVRANLKKIIGFTKDPRRLNVALTRPRQMLRLLINGATFNPLHPQDQAQQAMLDVFSASSGFSDLLTDESDEDSFCRSSWGNSQHRIDGYRSSLSSYQDRGDITRLALVHARVPLEEVCPVIWDNGYGDIIDEMLIYEREGQFYAWVCHGQSGQEKVKLAEIVDAERIVREELVFSLVKRTLITVPLLSSVIKVILALS
jgi:hypothetical protein